MFNVPAYASSMCCCSDIPSPRADIGSCNEKKKDRKKKNEYIKLQNSNDCIVNKMVVEMCGCDLIHHVGIDMMLCMVFLKWEPT